MFDRLVADGDRTTTGGQVIARSDFYDEDGRMYARKENKATCGNCKGAWPIYGTASNWMDNGEPYVKDLDRVLCPCGKNFVLAAAGSNLYYSNKSDAVSVPEITTASHWIAFHLNEGGNCEGLQCVAYFSDGSQETGTFDAGNAVEFERGDNGSACTRIELLYEHDARSSGSVTEALLSAIAS